MSGEIQIIHGLQTLFSAPGWHAFAVFCARDLIYFLVIPVALTGVWRKNKSLGKAAYRAAFAALLAYGLAILLGWILGRIRPFHASAEIALWINPPLTYYSFPSGHASVSFAVAFAILYGNVSLGLVTMLMATGIVLGRVVTGVHYPTDIIAGAALGFLAYTIIDTAMHHLSVRRVKKTAATPIEPHV
ncbi:MAG: phosphatase PAP2 family protein [bacterium]|nr:phosphatase PAP2 family protein [bacterium]